MASKPATKLKNKTYLRPYLRLENKNNMSVGFVWQRIQSSRWQNDSEDSIKLLALLHLICIWQNWIWLPKKQLHTYLQLVCLLFTLKVILGFAKRISKRPNLILGFFERKKLFQQIQLVRPTLKAVGMLGLLCYATW